MAKKIKVSQKTIDDIKKMGMTKALKLAGMNAQATQAGAVAEYQEAARRMYGAKRVAAASSEYRAKNAPKKPTDSRFSSSAPKKPLDSRFSTAKAKPADSRFSTGTSKKAAAPKKATVSRPNPSSASIAAAEARAGGKYKYNASNRVAEMSSKTPAQKAKDAAATAARRKAAADAVKRAGGRTA